MSKNRVNVGVSVEVKFKNSKEGRKNHRTRFWKDSFCPNIKIILNYNFFDVLSSSYSLYLPAVRRFLFTPVMTIIDDPRDDDDSESMSPIPVVYFFNPIKDSFQVLSVESTDGFEEEES